MRIQYKCLVPIYVLPEIKQNYKVLSPNSYTYISARALYKYFQDRSVYFAAAKYVDRSCESINHSQTPEFGN